MPCILRRYGVLPSTPHSPGIVRLASGAFYEAISLTTFYEIIILDALTFSFFSLPPTSIWLSDNCLASKRFKVGELYEIDNNNW
ncbi:MAG: hypothetical protein NTY64_22135 [Deltaproteobacteria bacterium]|nr:hypothetical protein [Deltaproteobacteria bacterium]